MNDVIKMTSPDNKRKNNHNVAYGNIDGIVDYHLIGNFKINGKTIKEHFKEKDEMIERQNKSIEQFKKVFEIQNEEIRKMKERLDRYGI